MIQVNLIPDVKKEHIQAVRQKKVVVTSSLVASGVFFGLVVLLAVAVFGVQKSRISSLSDQINTKIATLQSVEDLDKVLTIQNQLTAIPGLYDSKPKVGNLFKYLSVITPEDVELTSTQVAFAAAPAAGATANMELSGKTSTFKDANRFADILKNAQYSVVDPSSGQKITGPAFTSVVMASLAKSDGDGVTGEATVFTVILTYNTDLFNIKYTDAEITVPSITSSVSSTEKPSFNPKPFSEDSAPEVQEDEGGEQ